MRKTAWIALILCIAVLAGCTTSQVGTVEDTGSGTDSVKIKGNPFDTLSLLDIGKIQSINYTVSGEGGSQSGSTTDKVIMAAIIEKLTGVQINGITDKSVDDDDLIIKIVTEQSIIEFAFEGDAIVIGENRFEVANLAPLKDYILELIG
ncbi:MAG: hypothetical protein IJJ34_06535 [Clostridia bacterium]|nr:hypothetical protein [Clostridia bacterium]